MQYAPNSLTSSGKSEIVFVMMAGKQSSTDEIMIVPGHLGAYNMPQPRNVQSDMIS